MEELKNAKKEVKSFRVNEKTKKTIDEIITRSGKSQNEFFEDLVSNLKLKEIEQDESISTDLRKNFDSDVQKIKTAQNLIISTFISQMENITTEKNNWELLTNKKLEEKQEQYNQLESKYTELVDNNKLTKLKITELTEENNSINKEKENVLKRVADLEQLNKDRSEKIQELNDRINKLNEIIINKEEELNTFESIRKKQSDLEKEVQKLKNKNLELIKKHDDEIRNTTETMLFNFEKEKHQLEVTLSSRFNQEKENLRNEVRKETEKSAREFYLLEMDRIEIKNKHELEQIEEKYTKLINQFQNKYTLKRGGITTVKNIKMEIDD